MHSEELTTAITAARAGADKLLKHFSNLAFASIKTKVTPDGYAGIVTAADVESEKAIVSIIKNAFPDHQILAEEEHADQVEGDDLWIIDPLDGTNNFANGIPHFAVSIAYYHKGEAQCGVILDPMRNDTFTVQRGVSAFWNSSDVKIKDHSPFEDSMIAVGFYYDRGPMMQATLRAIEELFQQNIHGIRRFGTAALDLVQVGLGRFGGFFEYELAPWDFAAARLFVEEAGGKITTCDGSPLTLTKSSVLATNQTLYDPMLEIVRKHIP